MKKLVALFCIFIVGCIGSATPNNPLDREGQRLWWQADTATITSNNPWNKFIPKKKAKDWTDPWNSFEQPAIFPEGWKPALMSTKNKEYLRLRRQLLILKLRRAKRIRNAKEKLDKAKKRLERLGRTI